MTEQPARRPTIRDVAERAGVSHQTVSRFLRFDGGLKAATSARIDAAVRELGYRPNLVARSMRTRRTGRLAILLPAMIYDPAQVLRGAFAAAHEAGFVVEVLSIDGGAEARTERVRELAASGQVEGILSFAPLLPFDRADGAAIVVSDDYDDGMRGIGELADGRAVAELIDALAAMGHRRFVHVAGSAEFASARNRRQTYLDTVEHLGLDSLGVVDGDWSAESGIDAVRRLPEDALPLAVIAGNDLVAAGVVRGAIERGWRVPEDLSVTGWDDDPLGRYLSPALTTVAVDREQLGRTAMARLVGLLRGGGPAVRSTLPLNRVIWRESTGPVFAG